MSYALLYLETLAIRKFATRDELKNAIADASGLVLALRYHHGAELWFVMEQAS